MLVHAPKTCPLPCGEGYVTLNPYQSTAGGGGACGGSPLTACTIFPLYQWSDELCYNSHCEFNNEFDYIPCFNSHSLFSCSLVLHCSLCLRLNRFFLILNRYIYKKSVVASRNLRKHAVPLCYLLIHYNLV